MHIHTFTLKALNTSVILHTSMQPREASWLCSRVWQSMKQLANSGNMPVVTARACEKTAYSNYKAYMHDAQARCARWSTCNGEPPTWLPHVLFGCRHWAAYLAVCIAANSTTLSASVMSPNVSMSQVRLCCMFQSSICECSTETMTLLCIQVVCRAPVAQAGRPQSQRDCVALRKTIASARRPAKRTNRVCSATSTATPSQVKRCTCL